MIKPVLMVVMVALTIFVGVGSASAGPNVTIYELQYTTDPNGNSLWDGNTVDCNFLFPRGLNPLSLKCILPL